MNKKFLKVLLATTICSLTTASAWAANEGGQLQSSGRLGEVYIGEYNATGAANDQEVTIDSEVLDSRNNKTSVAGGYGSSAAGQISAQDNKVNIKGGGMINVYGGYADTGIVNNNTVTISGGTMSNAYGGYSPYNNPTDGSVHADVTNNTLIFNNGTVTGELIAGYSSGNNAPGNAIGNKLYINGGTIGAGNVYMMGGLGKDAIGNEVHVTGGYINGYIVGGQSNHAGVSQGNKVYISGGTVTQEVYGGFGNALNTGDISGNTVEIFKAESGTVPTVSGDIYGGNSEGAVKVANNIVSITGVTVSNVRGGAAGWWHTGSGNSGDAISNKVNITDAKVTGDIRGGYSAKQKAGNNTITIKNSTVTGATYGGFTGFTTDNADGSKTENSGDADTNTVNIEGGSASTIYGGRVYSASGKAINNQVNISGNTTISKGVYGGGTGAAVAGMPVAGDASSNQININGATISGFIYGGSSITGQANSNEINISSGNIAASVYGGYSAATKTADNTINISGNANITGDFIVAGFGKTEATGNKVTISGTPTFGANTAIFGANGAGQNNNTLEIHTKNLTAGNIANFDHYNFYLPANMVSGETVLTLTGGTAGSQTNISNTTVAVGIEGSRAALKAGDSVNLLKNDKGIKADNIIKGKLQQGVSIEYDFETELSADGKNFVAKLKGGGSVTEQTKSPVETQVATVGFVNSGADMVTTSGIQNAVSATGAGKTPEMFGAMGGGMTRQQSGSYTDVRGYNLALGFAKSIQNTAGKLVVGPFIEAGWGNYTTHLDSGIRGDGSTQYYGLGVLARQENNSGLYYEGSLRGGVLKSDYSSNDLVGASGSAVHSSYDSSSTYYGLHVGIGKVAKLNDKVKADIYAKLMYTHQTGDTVSLGGEGNGERYEFDAVDSIRTRLGLRLNKEFSLRNTGYVGLAYEYEFNGEARATVNGFSTPAPSIKGSSGMLEVGYIIEPKDKKGMAIDLNLQGWAGKKSGVNGSVNLIWKM